MQDLRQLLEGTPLKPVSQRAVKLPKVAVSNAEPFAPEPKLITVPTYQRAKRKEKKGVSLDGLPETVVEYRLPEEELTCSCGHERYIIGQDVTKELVVVPARFSVTKHVQHVCACRRCENHGDRFSF